MPYEVAKQISKVTYKLYMPERQEKDHFFHINLFKEVHTHQEPSQQLLVCAVKDEEVPEKCFPTLSTDPAAVDLSHLSPPQQKQKKPLLEPSLFQETPGFTSRYNTRSGSISYRIPERLVPQCYKNK